MNIGEQLKRLKNLFAKKEEIEKGSVDKIAEYQKERLVVKSLFDNEVIDLEEYIEKIKTIDQWIGEVKKEEEPTVIYNYADAVIRNEVGAILFLRRSAQDKFWPDCWCLPGGKIELEDKNEEAAMRREVLEETNLKITHSLPLAIKHMDNGSIIHMFEGFLAHHEENYTKNAITLDNEEHYAYQYIHPKDFDKYNFIGDLRETLEELMKPRVIAVEIFSKGEKDEELPELKRAQKYDLITLPDEVIGTNCGNCKFFNFENFNCNNQKIAQRVGVRMCCNLWDAEGVKRKWESNN